MTRQVWYIAGIPDGDLMKCFVRSAALAAVLALSATPVLADANFAATLDNATTQTAGRITRDGVPSGCGAPKVFPGMNDVVPGRGVDTFTVTNNSGVTQCYTATLTQTAGDLFVVAYLGAYDPNNLATNYLGDPGTSASGAPFGINVPNGATVTFVVHEVNVGGGLGQSYTLGIVGPVAPPIPTLAEWAMIGLGGLLAAAGAAFAVNRRRRYV